MCVCVCVCIYVYVYIYVCICMYIYMYIYIYMQCTPFIYLFGLAVKDALKCVFIINLQCLGQEIILSFFLSFSSYTYISFRNVVINLS